MRTDLVNTGVKAGSDPSEDSGGHIILLEGGIGPATTLGFRSSTVAPRVDEPVRHRPLEVSPTGSSEKPRGFLDYSAVSAPVNLNHLTTRQVFARSFSRQTSAAEEAAKMRRRIFWTGPGSVVCWSVVVADPRDMFSHLAEACNERISPQSWRWRRRRTAINGRTHFLKSLSPTR